MTITFYIYVYLPGAEEALLRRDLPAGEGRPDITAAADPQGSQAGLRCRRRRGEEVPWRLHPGRGGQSQRDIPSLLQTRLGHLGQTSEGRPKAGREVGLPAPTSRENPQQRSPAHPAQVPAVGRLLAPPRVLQRPPLRSTDAFKNKKDIQVRATSIPESPVTNEHRGRLLFWIRACRQKALYCACRAPCHPFYSIYLLLLIFSFISPFLFLHYIVVSACTLAQTTLKYIHSVLMALWD